MKGAVTLLLLFVLFLGESFAGYSTGVRRTPKPKEPEIIIVKPVIVVYPSDHQERDDPLWKDPHGDVEQEDVTNDKVKGEEITKVDKDETGHVKVVEPQSGSDHWVPSHDTSPIIDVKNVPHDVPAVEDKKVPHDFPVEDKKVPYDIPPNEDKKESHHVLPIVDKKEPYDVPVEDKKVPHDIPPNEDKKESHHVLPIVDKKEPYDVPIEDKKVPHDIPPNEDKKESHHVLPVEDKKELYDVPVEDKKEPYDVPIEDKKESYHVPVENKKEPYDIPVKLDDKPVIEEKHPYSQDETPSKVSDEKPNPYISEEEYGGGDFSAKTPLNDEDSKYKDANDKTPPLKEPYDVFDKPIPFPLVPPKDIPVVPPGAKTEVLEPYPMKVAGGNKDINLYELTEKLELSRFLHLVEEADLKDLLTGKGPLTIFAPSDYALSKLDADTIRKLASDKELLRQFVLYHCVDGQIYGPSLEERDSSAVTTKFDRAIHINKYGEGWFVNGVPITIKDQICSNGVIHVIDDCLYPSPGGDLLDTLDKQENFKIFTELIRNAKLEKELKGEVIYTIFAPTDVAFSKLPPANLEWLKWDIPAIKRMFRQLTVNGMYYTNWIPREDGKLTSIDQETTLSLSGYPDSISVNGVGLSQYDITASNGCIHAIDDIWFLSELGTPSANSGHKKKHD